MLKFIDKNDFLLVDEYKTNIDGSIAWTYDEGIDAPTHSGVIREGFIRTKEVQTGTETVVVGQTDPVYEYDEETGEGVLVTPAQDITEEQPVFEEITVNVWDKLKELEADGAITIEPVDLSVIKEQAKQTINQLREQYISGGVTYEVSGTTYTFQTGPQSIVDLMGAVIAGSDVTWLTSDNTSVPMTNTQLIGLGQAVATHKESYVYQARTHKDNIEACTTKAEIDTYMTSLSWT